MDLLYRLARPLLFRMDAERAHRAVLDAAASISESPWMLQGWRNLYGAKRDPLLQSRVFGLDFPSPLGVAAGLDKNGEAINFWKAIGFGFVEVGTVTPGQGQEGNEKPRLERAVDSRALVNRMGFNNAGAPACARNVIRSDPTVMVGVNIGKAKDTPLEHALNDYITCLQAVSVAADYVVLNISSPNTPNLRKLQDLGKLEPFLISMIAENNRLAVARGHAHRPLLLKIAPDIPDRDCEAVVDLAVNTGVAGLIVSNTTVKMDVLKSPASIMGGISGAPLKDRALELTKLCFFRSLGELPIIGVGGISTVDDAYERIKAGASLLQVYTALVYEGPSLAKTLLRGIAERMRKDGYTSMESVVGVNV